MRTKLVPLLVLCFVLLVSQVALAQYTGGSSDGYAMETSSLTKIGPDVFFAGGSGDGYAMGTSAADSSLPVELSAFSATTFDGNVILKWRTETETNNLGFRVYRSANKEGPFEKVAFVDGHGSTPLPNDYTFTDKKAKDGETYYYYLEDIDIAGVSNKSDIIKVVLPPARSVPSVFGLFQNYPNPFNPDTWIPYDLAADTEVTITIYTLQGHHIRTLELGTQPASSYLVKEKAAYWDGRSHIGERVSSGIYYYHLQAGEFTATKKMIILK